ncbi:unnamed protein product [Nesidiocoris tenuis]|uniref:Uncharacterized protein n=1 Tax=Nesidiocoris tenuis TaxID=355587 RepID=A0A6H5GBA5_9HEMI|nr:unnamed protein product [Nesidiocoris tenuis]
MFLFWKMRFLFFLHFDPGSRLFLSGLPEGLALVVQKTHPMSTICIKLEENTCFRTNRAKIGSALYRGNELPSVVNMLERSKDVMLEYTLVRTQKEFFIRRSETTPRRGVRTSEADVAPEIWWDQEAGDCKDNNFCLEDHGIPIRRRGSVAQPTRSFGTTHFHIRLPASHGHSCTSIPFRKSLVILIFRLNRRNQPYPTQHGRRCYLFRSGASVKPKLFHTTKSEFEPADTQPKESVNIYDEQYGKTPAFWYQRKSQIAPKINKSGTEDNAAAAGGSARCLLGESARANARQELKITHKQVEKHGGDCACGCWNLSYQIRPARYQKNFVRLFMPLTLGIGPIIKGCCGLAPPSRAYPNSTNYNSLDGTCIHTKG